MHYRAKAGAKDGTCVLEPKKSLGLTWEQLGQGDKVTWTKDNRWLTALDIKKLRMMYACESPTNSFGKCYESHPYAYFDGKYCCKTNQEYENGGSQSEKDSGTCDGKYFNRQSTCCNKHEFVKCPHKHGCINAPVQSGSLILVETGIYGTRYRDDSQVVDISSTKSCPKLSSYPIKLTGATGGILNGSPLLCGGVTGSFQSACYKHDKFSNEWTLLTNMKTERYGASCVITNGALWVAGGSSNGNTGLSSSELIYADGTKKDGPGLPAARHGHCMTTLDDGNIIMIGGFPSSNHKSVLIYNPEDNFSFVTGPSTIYDRRQSACLLFYSPMYNKRPVVLLAGGTGQSTVEILDYTNVNATWEQIESLPETHDSNFLFWGARGLPSLSGDGAIIQFNEYFYELVCSSTSCNWNIMEQKLKKPVKDSVMMYLPDDYNC